MRYKHLGFSDTKHFSLNEQSFISTNKNASYGKEKAAQRAKTAFSKCVFWVT
jgi:hypothetical protein